MNEAAPGWVYVLASARPGVVKIGRSTRNAGVRAGELERSEGYAAFGPFREVWSRPVSDCARVELAAHRMLAHRRVKVGRTPCRELFRVEADEACRVVQAAADSLHARVVAVRQPRRPTHRFPRWRPRRSSHAARVFAAASAAVALLWLLDGPGGLRLPVSLARALASVVAP